MRPLGYERPDLCRMTAMHSPTSPVRRERRRRSFQGVSVVSPDPWAVSLVTDLVGVSPCPRSRRPNATPPAPTSACGHWESACSPPTSIALDIARTPAA